jgi:hypothetical protein
MPTFTILDEERTVTAEARSQNGAVRIAPDALRQALGWELRPEGLCRGDVCVPVREQAALADARGISLAALAEALGRPLALDADEHAAALGTPAATRGAALASLEAPDFTLPDLEGRLHSLSEHRGKKVLLIAYASW